MKKLYIIAECAQGYEGNVEIAKLLVRCASMSGASAVKFQVVYADDLAEKNYQYYKLFQSLEMSASDWLAVRDYAKEKSIDFVIDVFGNKSLEIARKIKPDGIKLHSTTFYDNLLLEQVLEMSCNLYLSIGGIFGIEIKALFDRYKLSSTNKVCILYGFQAEPTPIGDNNLARINELKHSLNYEHIGFMDHSDGDGLDTIQLSAVALGLGVNIFEKHITIDRTLQMEDYMSALNPTQFKNYVETLNRLQLAIGNKNLDLSEKEIQYRNNVLKRVVAADDCIQGTKLEQKHLRLSRSVDKKGCFYYDLILGKALRVAVSAGEAITEDMVE